jgi:hypothetical protein
MERDVVDVSVRRCEIERDGVDVSVKDVRLRGTA